MARTILVPVDFSPMSEAVTQLGAREARCSHAHMHLLHVSERSEALSAFETEYANLAKLAQSLEDVDVEMEVVHGEPGREILAAIDRLDPEIVVVGSHGHGAVYDLVVGDVTEALLRGSTRPILILPANRGR